jgi:leucyl-tRNA synthetase
VLALTPYRHAREGERLDIGDEGILVTFEEAAQMPEDQVFWRWSRMSKSKGNVVTPEQAVEQSGADAMRIYLLFVAPFGGDVQWDNKGMEGSARFLSRVFKFVDDNRSIYNAEWRSKIATVESDELTRDLRRATHQAIRDVTERIEKFEFNTYISGMMIFLNEATKLVNRGDVTPSSSFNLALSEALETMILLISPAAPHTGDELWSALGKKDFALHADWPKADAALAAADSVTIAVQVNGKLRDTMEMPAASTKEALEASALALPKIKPFVEGKSVKKVIVVPEKLVNIVVA